MTNPSRIIGAGLSGLIAAHAWPRVPIVEALSEPQPHRALLRFRSDVVANLTGIPFRKVLVRKGLWSRGKFVAPSIALANAYSRKVLGGRVIGDRSVWSLDPVERWIAPDNFQEQLLHHVMDRVTFNVADDMKVKDDRPFISTAPMLVALGTLGIKTPFSFQRWPIAVQRFLVPNCDVHQTIYFPDDGFSLYRASITGDVLIVESIGVENDTHPEDLEAAFGMRLDGCVSLGNVRQNYGKIINLPDAERRALLFKLTNEHGLYSLGRFAQWRNILLDDVALDIKVIKHLLATDRYELRKAAS